MSNKKSSRRILWIILSSLLAVLLILVGGFFYKANSSLNSIKREKLIGTPKSDSTTTGDYEEETYTTPPDPSEGKPLTYLILGTDKVEKDDKGRSDSIMMAYVPSNRSKIYLISFPRDLYVSIPGHEGKQKINAAYELGGPQLTVATVQSLLKTQVQHAALINFEGFISMVDSLGGVKIDNPYQGCDDSQMVCWNKGELNLTNQKALQYVRWRHGLPNGDITRSANQQRVVKAIINKTLSAGTLSNPNKLLSIVETVGKSLTLDESLDNQTIINTALNLRVSSGEDVRTITFPIKGYLEGTPSGSVDLIDSVKLSELRTAISTDSLEDYWLKHKDDPVAGEATLPENQVLKSLKGRKKID